MKKTAPVKCLYELDALSQKQAKKTRRAYVQEMNIKENNAISIIINIGPVLSKRSNKKATMFFSFDESLMILAKNINVVDKFNTFLEEHRLRHLLNPISIEKDLILHSIF
jgi:hypothetical protein